MGTPGCIGFDKPMQPRIAPSRLPQRRRAHAPALMASERRCWSNPPRLVETTESNRSRPSESSQGGLFGELPGIHAPAMLNHLLPRRLRTVSASSCRPPSRRRVTRFVLEAVCTAYDRSEEHTSELQSLTNLVCRLLLEKKKI